LISSTILYSVVKYILYKSPRQRVKAVEHQAASPATRPDASPDTFLAGELNYLDEKMKLHEISLQESKRLLEELKEREERQLTDAGLALSTYERCCLLKEENLRTGLQSLDAPMKA
jgi:hypothetical protein